MENNQDVIVTTPEGVEMVTEQLKKKGSPSIGKFLRNRAQEFLNKIEAGQPVKMSDRIYLATPAGWRVEMNKKV